MSIEVRERYHHGGLRQALIDAALAIAAEQGVDAVTVREAGKRAGVSSGAPFRHFPNKTALMTAVAEEAMQRFRDEITRALAGVDPANPLLRFRALGTAYLAWVTGNPTHFEIISSRRLIDFDGSEILVRLNGEIRGMMVAMLEAAARAGQLRPGPLEPLVLQSRALIYGLARTWVDGQFAQWGGTERAAELMRESLDGYVALLAR
jgi:AcrR family transcriptional regulator